MIDSLRKIGHKGAGYVNSNTLGVAAAFAAKGAGTGFGFLFSILLARLLGPAGTGVYLLAFTVVSIGATIARLGLDNAVLRFAAVAHDQGDPSTLAALYRKSTWLVVVAGVAVTFVTWLAINYLPLGGDQASELQAVLPFMLLALVPTALIQLQGEFFKATGAPGAATFVQVAVLPMLLVLGSAVLVWWGNTTVQDIALLYLIAATASVLLAGAAWSRRNPGFWGIQGHFETRRLLRTSLPLLWVASMNLLMNWTDILVLGVWTDSATVGVYGIAGRIAALTAFILIAVNSVTAPRFAALHAQGNDKALELLARRSAAWMLLTVSPIIVVLLLFPEWILQLFGTDFVGGAVVLRILALGQLVNVALGSVGYLLMMTGYGRLMRNNIIFCALVNLAGNLVMVPAFGAVGAAVSTAISLALLNIIAFLQVKNKLGINTMGYLFRRSDA